MIRKEPFHFYASSVGEWHVDDDLDDLIKFMKRHKLNFTLWKVPGPTDREYELKGFAPVVNGRVYLGTYQLLDMKRWKQVCEDIVDE